MPFRWSRYADAPPAVKAVYDDIMATRKTDWINNFWKAPTTTRRPSGTAWESTKEVRRPGGDQNARRGHGS